MARAARVHAIRSTIVAATLLVAALVGMKIRSAVVERHNATRAEGLVDELMRADIGQVPGIVEDLAAYRTWADPLLKADWEQANKGSAERLNLSLALLPVDQTQVKSLREQLLMVTPQQFPIVRDALLNRVLGVHWTGPSGGPGSDQVEAKAPPTQLAPWWNNDVVEPLWATALDAKRGVPPRFQAACALATYAARRPALECNRQAGGGSARRARSIGILGVAGSPAARQRPFAWPPYLDLPGQIRSRAVPHLRHGSFGRLCGRPARRAIRPAGQRGAVSVSHDFLSLERSK